MFPAARQAKLDSLLKKLKVIPEFRAIWQDDWDSAGINVFIQLHVSGNMSAIRFPNLGRQPLRRAKNLISKACAGFWIDFLDYPAMQYSYCPGCPGIPASKHSDGYDKDTIKILVYI